MRIPAARLTKEAQKQAALENQIANELIHNLVIKIISWKVGILDGAKIKGTNKISPAEWATYKKHILKISTSESKEKVLERITKTEKAIQDHDGFSDHDV